MALGNSNYETRKIPTLSPPPVPVQFIRLSNAAEAKKVSVSFEKEYKEMFTITVVFLRTVSIMRYWGFLLTLEVFGSVSEIFSHRGKLKAAGPGHLFLNTFIRQNFACATSFKTFISGNPWRPRGSQSGRQRRRDKVFKHGRESPKVTTLIRPFPKGRAKAGSWLGTKNAFYVLLCPIGKQHLLSLKTFVVPFLPTRLTTPGSPRMTSRLFQRRFR